MEKSAKINLYIYINSEKNTERAKSDYTLLTFGDFLILFIFIKSVVSRQKFLKNRYLKIILYLAIDLCFGRQKENKYYQNYPLHPIGTTVHQQLVRAKVGSTGPAGHKGNINYKK